MTQFCHLSVFDKLGSDDLEGVFCHSNIPGSAWFIIATQKESGLSQHAKHIFQLILLSKMVLWTPLRNYRHRISHWRLASCCHPCPPVESVDVLKSWNFSELGNLSSESHVEFAVLDVSDDSFELWFRSWCSKENQEGETSSWLVPVGIGIPCF